MWREDWNKSGCNPFNSKSKIQIINESCERITVLAIPETPYIRNVKNPLGNNPFIEVEQLRTPVKGFDFQIDAFFDRGTEFVKRFEFERFNYQNYVPENIFMEDVYYLISCVGFNDSGISKRSNEYILDMINDKQTNPPLQKMICGGQLICGVPIVCG